MDDGLAGGHDLGVAVVGEARAEGEDSVGLDDPGMGGAGGGAAAGAEGEGVPLVESGLALHGGEDGDVEQLGELAQMLRGARREDAGTGPDHRTLGGEEGGHGRLDVTLGGALAEGAGGVVVLLAFGHLLGTDVGGELDDDGSAAATAKGVEGAAHGGRDLGGRVDGLDGLDDAAVVLGG